MDRICLTVQSAIGTADTMHEFIVQGCHSNTYVTFYKIISNKMIISLIKLKFIDFLIISSNLMFQKED